MSITWRDREEMAEEKRRETRRERSRWSNQHGPVEDCDGGPWDEPRCAGGCGDLVKDDGEWCASCQVDEEEAREDRIADRAMDEQREREQSGPRESTAG